LVVQKEEKLEEQQLTFVRCLCEVSSEIAEVRGLAQRFGRLIREHDLKEFPIWLEDATRSTSKEIKSFVVGLKRDQKAVEAALQHPWSNGQTEGQVNKLKNVKRQMYGRAKFDLLKARVLDTP
jgi:transposase